MLLEGEANRAISLWLRYNIVGHRKHDRIHPMANAQQAILHMMTRHVCPK